MSKKPRTPPAPVESVSKYVCETCDTEPLGLADFRVHLRNAHGIPIEEKVAVTKQNVMHLDSAKTFHAIDKITITRDGETLAVTHSYSGPRHHN